MLYQHHKLRILTSMIKILGSIIKSAWIKRQDLDVFQHWVVIYENLFNRNTLHVYIRQKSRLESFFQMAPAVSMMKNTAKYFELLTGSCIQIIKIVNWEIHAINMIFFWSKFNRKVAWEFSLALWYSQYHLHTVNFGHRKLQLSVSETDIPWIILWPK